MIDLITRLRDKGIEVDITPLATTLVAEGLSVTAPTLDEALMLFLEKSLEELRSLRRWKADTMPIVTQWSREQGALDVELLPDDGWSDRLADRGY